MERRADRYGGREMRHSRSEDLLGAISRSPSPCVDLPTTASEDDLIAASALRDSGIYDEAVSSAGIAGPSRRRLSSSSRTVGVPVDPEDSIRDIVTENDLYRSVWINSLQSYYESSRYHHISIFFPKIYIQYLIVSMIYTKFLSRLEPLYNNGFPALEGEKNEEFLILKVKRLYEFFEIANYD